MPNITTTMSVNLSVVDGITGIAAVLKAADTAGCCGHYDGDLAKAVMIDGAHEYCAVVLPSPGLLRFLADKIERLS